MGWLAGLWAGQAGGRMDVDVGWGREESGRVDGERGGSDMVKRLGE